MKILRYDYTDPPLGPQGGGKVDIIFDEQSIIDRVY